MAVRTTQALEAIFPGESSNGQETVANKRVASESEPIALAIANWQLKYGSRIHTEASKHRQRVFIVAKPLAYVLDDIRFQQHLRAAEGYLDIVLAIADRWPPEEESRDRLATRALAELDRLPDTEKYKADKAYLQGQALRTMERYEEAIEPLSLSAELHPSNIHVQLALGWCYKRIGRLDLAIQALELALEISPDEGIIHYNLACYWSLAKNKGLALQYLRQSLDLDPNYLDMIADESDFDPIRDDPDFRMVTSVVV